MKERNGEHPFGDEGQIIALILFMLVWVSDSFFLHQSTFLTAWVSDDIRLTIASLLMLIAIGVYRSSHFIVSGSQRPNYLVNKEAFRYVRHPLYLASLIVYLALVIATLSIFSFLIGIVTFGFYNYIATYEELLLETRFGQAYQAYKQQTGRWLPRLSLTREPELIHGRVGDNKK